MLVVAPTNTLSRLISPRPHHSRWIWKMDRFLVSKKRNFTNLVSHWSLVFMVLMTLNSVEYDFVSDLEKFLYKKLIYVYKFSYYSQVLNFTVLFNTDKDEIKKIKCSQNLISWWSKQPPCGYMMTISNGNIFCVTGHLCGEFTSPGEFPAQTPMTRSYDVFFDLSLNKRLSKQSQGWWFEMQLRQLWRHCNDR